MKNMIRLSLILNILVLIPVCAGLLTHAVWATDVYGAATAARGILLSIYGAILLVSEWFSEKFEESLERQEEEWSMELLRWRFSPTCVH